MKTFSYFRPADLTEALMLLAEHPDGKAMSGGMTLIPALKHHLLSPSAIIDLAAISALKTIETKDGWLRAGALTTHAEMHGSAEVNANLPGLAGLAGQIGDMLVRNRGTVGGSVANADPAADYPAALLALEARIETDRRDIASAGFFTGLFETELEPSEIITSIRFRIPLCSAYYKLRAPASGYAVVGVYVARFPAGVRVAVTGCATSAFRFTELEKALTADFSALAVPDDLTPPVDLLSDLSASSDYRAFAILVAARRAVAAASAA